MKKIGIVIPCYNENITIVKFIDELELILANIDVKFELIIVDDNSSDHTPELLHKKNVNQPNVSLKVIRTNYNVGHQGAIYQGLCYAQKIDCSHVIVMDGDGEEDPEGIKQLIQFSDKDIVNVKRGKRTEKFLFRFFYSIYKIAFRIVTGKELDFGNYCLISRKIVDMAVARSYISFPAFLLKLKGERAHITLNRRKRIDGESKMTLNSLIYHGFRSFSEFAEEFILLLLKMAVTLTILLCISIGLVIYFRLFTDQAVAGWASTLSATLFNAALISFGFFFIGIVLLNIYHRNQKTEKAGYTILKP